MARKKKSSKASRVTSGERVMTARFPSHCSRCDGDIKWGSKIVYSGDRGPMGGKLVCHVECADRPSRRRSRSYEID